MCLLLDRVDSDRPFLPSAVMVRDRGNGVSAGLLVLYLPGRLWARIERNGSVSVTSMGGKLSVATQNV